MAYDLNVKVTGNIPAHRLLNLGPNDSEGNLTIVVANEEAAADFVSVRNLVDGEFTTVTLKDGIQVWEVEANVAMTKGTWVSCGPNGTAGVVHSNAFEHVGYLLEDVEAGQLAKVLRRESYNTQLALLERDRVDDLVARVTALEGGGV